MKDLDPDSPPDIYRDIRPDELIECIRDAMKLINLQWLMHDPAKRDAWLREHNPQPSRPALTGVPLANDRRHHVRRAADSGSPEQEHTGADRRCKEERRRSGNRAA